MLSSNSPRTRSSAPARALQPTSGDALGMVVVTTLLLLLLLAFPKEAAAINAAIRIKVGQPFPALKLPTLDGEIRSIEDFRGTKVVLHVFASW